MRKEFRTIRRYPMLLVGLLFWPVVLPSFFVLMGQRTGVRIHGEAPL